MKKIALLLMSFSLVVHLEGFKLLTSLYNEKHVERAQEYIECMKKNLEHPLIDEIIVFYDISNQKNNKILDFLKRYNKKIKIIEVLGRPSFGSFFKRAKQFSKGTRIIIANGDIYFNHTLSLLNDYDLTNKFLALTRWDDDCKGNLRIYASYDEKGNIVQKREASQDVWIFEVPLMRFKIDDIGLGTKHCDGKIAYEAQFVGLDVVNPCLSIQCCHIHNFPIRNYSNCSKTSRYMTVPWSHL